MSRPARRAALASLRRPYTDEWLPADAYVIVVEKAEDVLAEDRAELEALLVTLDAAGDFWSQPVDSPERFARGPVPFHVLLNVGPQGQDAAALVASVARAAGVQVRTDPKADPV
jgi:hypothetical protein